ncbi:uncharacterized protein MEPE_02512 [Melanopsichium pennsylvanicum]|uniref:BZIP domain-containing protein n=2 Tax=Melanopsichium pennsylvanicum TaxID=63383 RepID=A0AAJ5C4R8_9BASI|nr:putative protein [Melanopsichium pennsylvanicum 4]SNX83804.1 uncharacterized protein MEPE_02512 [Melanopsichium pennsylvanicum]
MQQPTATMAVPPPFGRRPSSSFAPVFPGGADARLTATHGFAPAHHHQNTPFPHQPSDLNSSYQYTSGRTPFDHQLPFDSASSSNVPSWFYNSAHEVQASNIPEAAIQYQLDPFAQHASTNAPNNLAGPSGPPMTSSTQSHASVSAPPIANFTAKPTPFSPTISDPFGVGSSGRAPTQSVPGAPHSLAIAVPPSLGERRSSDESAQCASASFTISEAGSSGANVPLQGGQIHSASESVGFTGSISPNSSARASGSPEALNTSQRFPAYTTAPAPPGGMIMGAPVSSSVLDSIDSWLAPAPIAPMGCVSSANTLSTHATAMSATKAPLGSTRSVSPSRASAAGNSHSSSRASVGMAFHPGSSSESASASAGAPFKTSIERRERNKASQRESRKRKQDRMETLESENAALRKALADMKKFSQALSNGAGIRGEDGAEVAPIQISKFTGAFHLDLIESHLEDESAEAEWRGMVGHRFPAHTSSAKEWDGVMPAIAASISDSDEDSSREDGRDLAEANTSRGSSLIKAESDAATDDNGKQAESSQSACQQAKKAMWEISLNQKRQKAAQSFPSMVAVPELVLYKVCRLYFSTLLPFSTKLKSGIINLRAAREMPGFIGGFDELPRFPGDPSFGATELYLPRNLMPTEMQLRIGFHPVEIAVMPYPVMRDRILTVLSAFHAIEELVQEEEDAHRFSEEVGYRSPTRHEAPQNNANKADTELNDEDIRKRTALVADMSAWKPKDFQGAAVMPDKSRVYSYGFLEKPRGSHRLRKPAQRWLDDFFYEVVQTLRVWSPAGDVFDGECFEFKESFFRKYPYLVDAGILRATNRWRRARGEDPIRL